MRVRSKKRELVIEEDSDAVVVRGGVRVEFKADGGIDVYSDAPVVVPRQ
jgi:hypothetical protein